MRRGINGWNFAKPVRWAEAARAARDAGFACIEPTLELEGELTVTSDEASCRQVAESIRAMGLEITSLACGLYLETPYTSPDAAIRERSRQLTIACLDRAMWMGAATILVIPGVVIHPRTGAVVCPYADALWYALDALQDLRFEAERRGVTIALENMWSGFLISPVELRDFIDRVNSAWVGAYFDTGNVLRYGDPVDWIRTLGRRMFRIHIKDYDVRIGGREGYCALGDGTIDWKAIMTALRETGYNGPLTYEGRGDLRDIAARMDKVLPG